VALPRALSGCANSVEDRSRLDGGKPSYDTSRDAASVDGARDGDVALDGLPTERGLFRLVNQMNALGPRFTGSPAHARYVQLLTSGLTSLGLTVERDTKSFLRWSANRWSLVVPSTNEQIPTTSYYPYSGETPAEGVTARLAYAGTARNPDYAGVRGKLVILDCPLDPVPLDTLFHVAAAYPPDAAGTFPKTATSPTEQLLAAPALTGALAAGAVGAILVWTNVSDEEARDQYLPFAQPHQGLPALWVGNGAGARLKALAESQTEVTLTLIADVDPNATTDSIWATLPGLTNEIIVVNSHTDGTNAVDENGSVAVLAIATAFSLLPLWTRRRTVVFSLTSGQLAAGPGNAAAWIRDHGDLVARTVAAVTIEHCGCMEWSDDTNGVYRATGRPEPGITMTPLGPEVRIFEAAMLGTANLRMFAMDSTNPYFGNGAAFFAAGIPTISYVPLPSYLFSAPQNGHIDKLSPSRMAAEVLGFARAIRLIDRIDAAALKA
jgi:hypothetical protein